MAKLVCDMWAEVRPSVTRDCATSSARGFFLVVYIKKKSTGSGSGNDKPPVNIKFQMGIPSSESKRFQTSDQCHSSAFSKTMQQLKLGKILSPNV